MVGEIVIIVLRTCHREANHGLLMCTRWDHSSDFLQRSTSKHSENKYVSLQISANMNFMRIKTIYHFQGEHKWKCNEF